MLANDAIIYGGLICAIGFSIVGICSLLVLLCLIMRYCRAIYYDYQERKRVLLILDEACNRTEVSFKEANSLAKFLSYVVKHPANPINWQRLSNDLIMSKRADKKGEKND